MNDKDYIIWLVGYVMKDNKPYFYALNFKTDDFDKTYLARLEITRNILKQLKLIK